MNESSFSTGFVFEYEDETKEMFVKPMHETFRDEIVETGFLSQALWCNVVLLKARNYLESESARKMKSTSYGYYRLKKGTPITLQHLIAIILYCDIGPLCTAFSETFRKENAFETMESVKKRHSWNIR